LAQIGDFFFALVESLAHGRLPIPAAASPRLRDGFGGQAAKSLFRVAADSAPGLAPNYDKTLGASRKAQNHAANNLRHAPAGLPGG
jgi:hypothetical protein